MPTEIGTVQVLVNYSLYTFLFTTTTLFASPLSQYVFILQEIQCKWTLMKTIFVFLDLNYNL